MTFENLEAAWQQAMDTTGIFYDVFTSLTGISQAELEQHFRNWNKMPHGKVLEISRKYGQVQPNFRAYLAEVTSSS